jgi:hypothetical protein
MKPTYETKSPAYRRLMGFIPCSKAFGKSFVQLMESLK